MSKADDLLAELQAGHPTTGAYSLDSSVAAEELNAVNRTRLVPIPATELIAWASAGNSGQDPPSIKLQDYLANDTNPAAFRGLAWGALAMLSNPSASLDLRRADRQAMLEGLVAGGVLSNEDKVSIESLATESVSRAEELGLGEVRPGTIQQVRPDVA